MRFTRSWTPRMWRRVRRLLVALGLAGVVLGVITSIEFGLVLFGSGLMGLVLLESTLMRSIIVEGQRQQHALTQIRPLMGELPLSISGWAADAILIHNTVRLILEVRPKLVLECGSGSSTIVIGRCLRALGHGQIISLEHEAEHARSTSDLVRLHALDGVVTVVTTPLIPVSSTGSGLWYGTEYEPLITDPIDVLLVDGPPGSVGPRARYPAVPVLKSRLAPECWVLLDDGDRPDERAIAHAWRSELNGKLLYLEGGRGGWLLHRTPTPPVTPGLTSG